MHPELNRGPNYIERQPSSIDSSFEYPDLSNSPERYDTGNQERLEQMPPRAEGNPNDPVIVVPVSTTYQQVAEIPQPQTNTSASSTLLAGDDDLIEVEWVKIAKQVISQTQDDPSARERALSELQKDYLMKRYGKVLGE